MALLPLASWVALAQKFLLHSLSTVFAGQQHSLVGPSLNTTGGTWPACGKPLSLPESPVKTPHEDLGQLGEGFLSLPKASEN